MAELIALWIVCKNIGAIARSKGVSAQGYQVRAVLLWFGLEIVGGIFGAVMGFEGILLYLAAFAGALLSLHFSFSFVRNAQPPMQWTRRVAPEEAAPPENQNGQ